MRISLNYYYLGQSSNEFLIIMVSVDDLHEYSTTILLPIIMCIYLFALIDLCCLSVCLYLAN